MKKILLILSILILNINVLSMEKPHETPEALIKATLKKLEEDNFKLENPSIAKGPDEHEYKYYQMTFPNSPYAQLIFYVSESIPWLRRFHLRDYSIKSLLILENPDHKDPTKKFINYKDTNTKIKFDKIKDYELKNSILKLEKHLMSLPEIKNLYKNFHLKEQIKEIERPQERIQDIRDKEEQKKLQLNKPFEIKIIGQEKITIPGKSLLYQKK